MLQIRRRMQSKIIFLNEKINQLSISVVTTRFRRIVTNIAHGKPKVSPGSMADTITNFLISM